MANPNSGLPSPMIRIAPKNNAQAATNVKRRRSENWRPTNENAVAAVVAISASVAEQYSEYSNPMVIVALTNNAQATTNVKRRRNENWRPTNENPVAAMPKKIGVANAT